MIHLVKTRLRFVLSMVGVAVPCLALTVALNLVVRSRPLRYVIILAVGFAWWIFWREILAGRDRQKRIDHLLRLHRNLDRNLERTAP